MVPLIAHGSGVDDLLWFLVPVAVGVVLLRLAERRARQRAAAGEEPGEDTTVREGSR